MRYPILFARPGLRARNGISLSPGGINQVSELAQTLKEVLPDTSTPYVCYEDRGIKDARKEVASVLARAFETEARGEKIFLLKLGADGGPTISEENLEHLGQQIEETIGERPFVGIVGNGALRDIITYLDERLGFNKGKEIYGVAEASGYLFDFEEPEIYFFTPGKGSRWPI